MVKRCGTGKLVLYRFFLFSDVLVYAHKTTFGQYRVHKQLLLSLLRAVPLPAARELVLSHPLKSFTVVADSARARDDWVEAISAAAAAARPRADPSGIQGGGGHDEDDYSGDGGGDGDGDAGGGVSVRDLI
jgi:hypothetical protein